MIFRQSPQDFKPRFEVASCFCEYEGKILLLLRQDHKPQGNTFGVPAGKMDKDENPLATIVREVKEEINVRIVPENTNFLETVYVRHDGYDFVYHMFKTQLSREQLETLSINDEEHKSYKWLPPAEALQENLIQDEDECIKICYATALS